MPSLTPDNETWETCPECGRYRQVETVPGLLHRTRICADCWNDPQKILDRADEQEAEARALMNPKPEDDDAEPDA